MKAEAHPGFNRAAAMETKERLASLDFTLAMIRSREAHLRTHQAGFLSVTTTTTDGGRVTSPADHTEFLAETTRIMREVRILTEAFYYQAERIRLVVRSRNPVMLPGMSDPGGHMGVSRIRNRLLQHRPMHPELRGFGGLALLGDDGPVLEPGEQTGIEQEKDSGLYRNAREFAERLEEIFTRALALRGGGGARA